VGLRVVHSLNDFQVHRQSIEGHDPGNAAHAARSA
jgi:hypothetical protein